MSNCPSCGALIVGSKCEYCGTVFDNAQERYRLAQVQENQYLRLNLMHQLDQLNSEIKSLEFKMNYDKIQGNGRVGTKYVAALDWAANLSNFKGNKLDYSNDPGWR